MKLLLKWNCQDENTENCIFGIILLCILNAQHNIHVDATGICSTEQLKTCS